MKGEAEYIALAAALDRMEAPECTDDWRFVMEHSEFGPDEILHLSTTYCRPCPIRDLCRAYGEAARPIAGIWGGKTYKPPKQRQPDATRRTADTTEMEIPNR